MGFLKTVKIDIGDGKMAPIDIYVNSEGAFTTTVPYELGKLLLDSEVHTETNQKGNPGFFSNTTLDGLIKSISTAVNMLNSGTLISRKVVIQYMIETSCSYMLSDGVVVPDGYWAKDDGRGWRSGTLSSTSVFPKPFGFQVYVSPKIRLDYKYHDGRTKSVYEVLKVSDYEKWGKLHWLDSIRSIYPVTQGTMREVEYSEEVADFFIRIVSALCLMNEQFEKFLDEDGIRKLSSSFNFNLKLL